LMNAHCATSFTPMSIMQKCMEYKL